MKVTLNLALLLMLLLQTSYGQTEGTYLPTSECSNYNEFLTSSTLDSLKYYADSIYDGGTIMLDLSKSDEYGGIEDLYPLLGVETGSTFQLIDAHADRINSDKKFVRFQQYHQGIKVGGGGYTVGYLISGEPGDPCDKAFMYSPHIVNGINIGTTPTVASNNLDNILNGTVIQQGAALTDSDIEHELVIAHNLLNYCDYHLVYKATYPYLGSKISWIDAHTGAVLKTEERNTYLDAPTQIYGAPPTFTVTLNDTQVGNTTILATPDGRVTAFDFSAFGDCASRTTGDFAGAATPMTTAPTWTTVVAPASMYQSFFVTSSLVPVFDGIGINFGAISVGIDCPEFNAFSLGGSTLATTFIVIGTTGTSSLGIFDVIGHELGHTFLNTFITSFVSTANGSLHEGIADMLGTYVESVVQGSTDWVIGDDVPSIATEIHRDLQNPERDCFTDASGLSSVHDRSEPLGHWFYLVAQTVGIQKAMQILLGALPLLPPPPASIDYGNLRTAVISYVDSEFAPCSAESLGVRIAWRDICVGPDAIQTDCFSIAGNPWVCEEDDHLGLYIVNPTGNSTYRWTFPSGWTVQGNQSGNTHVGLQLVVTDFPKYDWYPRFFKIKVHSPELGSDYDQFRIVKLIDCLGDDPTCEEFYEFQGGGGTENLLGDGSNSNPFGEVRQSVFIKVFDTMGRILYSGHPERFDKNTFQYSGIVVISHFTESGEFIRSEKNVLTR